MNHQTHNLSQNPEPNSQKWFLQLHSPLWGELFNWMDTACSFSPTEVVDLYRVSQNSGMCMKNSVRLLDKHSTWKTFPLSAEMKTQNVKNQKNKYIYSSQFFLDTN